MVSLSSSHHTLWPPESGSTPFQGFATAASIHPCHHARRHLRLLDILNYKVLGSVMSYWLTKAPSVGASGAIFGFVGLVSVFVIRHNGMVRGGNEDLMQIRQVIAINMRLDLMARGIDNWGHIGGFLGGSAMAWLIGPQWKYEYTTRDGRRVFMDSAPIPLLLRWRNERRRVLLEIKEAETFSLSA